MTSWRPTWWQCVIVVVVVVVLGVWGTLATIRQQGVAAWEAYVAEVRAAGSGASAEDYVAMVPAVDTSLQEDWWHWSESASARTTGLGDEAFELWPVVVGSETLPQGFRDTLARDEALFERGRAIVTDPRLVATVAGYAESDHAAGLRSWEWRIPSLLVARELALYLQHHIVFGEDPAAAMRDSAVFQRAWNHPGVLIDAMIGMAVGAIRDDAHLAAAWRGRRGPALQAWIAEPPRHLALTADAMDGERMLFTGELVRQVIAEGGIEDSYALLGGGGNPLLGACYSVLDWTFLPGEGARALRDLRAIAERWRGATSGPPPDLAWVRDARSPLVRIVTPNLMETGQTAFGADLSHRLHRLAAALVVAADRDGLPADQAELERRHPRLVAPGGDHPPLAYERLGEDRFRVSLDPATPLPAFVDPSRFATANDHGHPASPEPVVIERHSIELRLDPAPLPGHRPPQP